jgi:hypothetical protein
MAWPAECQLVRDWYEPHLLRLYDDGHLRAADIDQLEQIAAAYESRERFLTELTLDPPNATSGRAGAATLDEDYTILSTIHSAKGQEWRIVRTLNVVDGYIPSDMATGTREEIEEERLLYVAMTRAKDELDLVVPHRFYTFHESKVGDQHVYACRSRFIPDVILDSFDAHSWHERVQRANRPAKKTGRRPTLPPACFGCGGRRRGAVKRTLIRFSGSFRRVGSSDHALRRTFLHVRRAGACRHSVWRDRCEVTRDAARSGLICRVGG